MDADQRVNNESLATRIEWLQETKFGVIQWSWSDEQQLGIALDLVDARQHIAELAQERERLKTERLALLNQNWGE